MRAGARMIDLDHHLARRHLRIGEHVADRLTGPTGTPAASNSRIQSADGRVLQALGDERR